MNASVEVAAVKKCGRPRKVLEPDLLVTTTFDQARLEKKSAPSITKATKARKARVGKLVNDRNAVPETTAEEMLSLRTESIDQKPKQPRTRKATAAKALNNDASSNSSFTTKAHSDAAFDTAVDSKPLAEIDTLTASSQASNTTLYPVSADQTLGGDAGITSMIGVVNNIENPVFRATDTNDTKVLSNADGQSRQFLDNSAAVVETVAEKPKTPVKEATFLNTSSMDKRPVQPRPKSNILSQLGLDDQNPSSRPRSDDEAKREARQIEFVDMMLQAKRRKLLSSLSSRMDHLAEERMATALSINDLRLSRAAGDVVQIATGMAARRAGPAPAPAPAPATQQQRQVERRSVQASTHIDSNRHQAKPVAINNTTTISKAANSAPWLSSPASPPKPPRQPPPSSRLPPQQSSHPSQQQQQHLLRPSSNPNLQPSSNVAGNNPSTRRPTQLSYDELRKLPDFKRLSWSWTGLIVGIPVLLVTSWVIYKDYDKRMNERKLGLHTHQQLHQPLVGGPSSSSASSSSSSSV